jgi:DNA primase
LVVISTDIISQVREQSDITATVSSYVRLTPSGNSYKALCPFHNEKTPSFHVVPDKQIYHCFGCGKGGDVFSFVMAAEHLNFPEAVRFLAEKNGIEIPKTYEAENKNKREFDFLKMATGFFEDYLYSQDGKQALDYLNSRKISAETAKEFRLGCAPSSWNALYNHFNPTKEEANVLKDVGLIKSRGTSEGFYDIFRHRLIIPILDLHGRTIAFGGRILDAEDEPKYLNSPDTELFNKRKILFNLRNAIPAIRRQNAAIVVEGYLDVISLWQHGIKNVVATLGTAISEEQIQILARNCDTIYFSYDADEAGQRATIRAITLQKDSPINARIISYPDPKDDPDTFIQREGEESFKNLLNNTKDIYTFIIDNRTKDLKRPLEIAIKEQLIQEFKEIIPAIHSPIAKSEVIKKIAKALDINQELLTKEFSSRKTNEPTNRFGFTGSTRDAGVERQEWVLKHILENPKIIESIKALLAPEAFTDPQLKDIYRTISFNQEASNYSLTTAEIMSMLDNDSLVSRLSKLITTLEERPDEPFMDCVIELVKNHLKEQLKSLELEISDAEKRKDSSAVETASQMYLDIRRKIDMLY